MNNETIKIIDLGEATALLTIGFDLIRLEPSNVGKHKVFIFNKDSNSNPCDSEQEIEKYRRRELQVDALTFYRCGKELKNKIHEFDELKK